MNRKCAVYTRRSQAARYHLARVKLRTEWKAEASGNQDYNFKEPSKKKLSELIHLFPAEHKRYDGTLIGFSSHSDADGHYPIALVIDDDGFLDSVDVTEVKITDA